MSVQLERQLVEYSTELYVRLVLSWWILAQSEKGSMEDAFGVAGDLLLRVNVSSAPSALCYAVLAEEQRETRVPPERHLVTIELDAWLILPWVPSARRPVQ